MLSPYIILGFLLTIAYIFDYTSNNKRMKNVLFIVIFGVVTLMLMLRYNQGMDYQSYKYAYEYMGSSDLNHAFSYWTMEYGWKIISYFLGGVLKLDYKAFISVIAVVDISLLGKFIYDYSNDCKSFALFLAYPTLYLTYMFSALRESVVICIFLGLILKWMKNEKYLKVIIAIVFCGSLHSAGYLLFIYLAVKILPIFKQNVNTYLFVSCIMWFIGLLVWRGYVPGFVTELLNNSTSVYITSPDPVSIFALIERIGSCILLLFICKDDESDEEIMFFKRMYLIGFGIYGILLWSPLIASRLGILFKCLELPIYAKTARNNDNSKLACIFLLLLFWVMLLKNINSYIGFGGGESSILSVLTYPYTSIFGAPPENIVG